MTPTRARILVFSFFIFSILFSITTLGFSFTQITDNDLLITIGSCSVFSVPFKVVYTLDTKISAECSWTLSRSFVRIFLQFINIATVSALFITFYKKKNKYFLMLNILLGLIGIASVYSFISDATSVSKAIIFCNSDLLYFIDPVTGVHDTTNKECVFARYYGTLAFNVLTTVSIIGATVFAFTKRSTIFSDNQQNVSLGNKQQQQAPSNPYSNMI